MANRGDERVACYNTHVRRMDSTEQQEITKPRGGDFFRFDVIGIVRRHTNYFSRRRILSRRTLFESTVYINCKNFFEENEGMLRSYLSKPEILSHEYFTPEGIELIAQQIISQVQQLFRLQSLSFDDNYEAVDSKSQEFPLDLEIVVDLQRIEEVEETARAIMGESMQLGATSTMTPASNEAIQSLNTFTLPEKCNICAENFHADEGYDKDGKLSSMPCGHVYHHHCIVKWLQISHMCPLCRYRMPTVTD